ncbi:hypothetical protein GQ473_01915 [archaeon]|nr:hypothetical protein [archaeon]
MIRKLFVMLFVFVCFFLSFVCSVFAIGVSPAFFDAGVLEMNRTYEYYAYLNNEDSTVHNITLLITPRAAYLEQCALFFPKQFEIKPGEIKDIKILLNTSSCELTPGNHQLIILPEVAAKSNVGVNTVSLSSISVQFLIEGEVTPMLVLEDFNMPAKLEFGEEFYFSLTAKNTGNVRVGAIPFVNIKKHGVVIHTAKGTTEALIEPGITRKFEFSHNYPLKSGEYVASAFVRYFDGQVTNIKDVSFNVIKSSISEEVKNEGGDDSISIAPGFFETINIGEVDDVFITEEEFVSENYRDNDMGIVIVDLEAFIVAPSVSVLFSFENMNDSDINYSFSVAIFDSNGRMVTDIKEDSTIRAFELKKVNKVMYAGLDKTYAVEVDLIYDVGGTKKTVQRRVIVKAHSSPTGLFAYTSSTGIFVVVLIFISLYLFNKRKMVPHRGKKSLDAVLNKYSNIERNISAAEDSIHRLKKKIRR